MSKKGDKETGRQGDKGKRKYLALENMSDPVSGRLTLKGTVLEAEAGAEWVKHAILMGWMREVDVQRAKRWIRNRYAEHWVET